MKPAARPVRGVLRLSRHAKSLLVVLVLYFAVPVIVPGFRNAADKIRDVKPTLIALGFALEMAALYSYSLLTRAALGTSGRALSSFRLFRIQMSTKALSSVVPGGSAAGSALGYRLMTMSGVAGPDAGFALATAGLGSAVVLNIIFLTGLIVSIPIRGVNPGYAFAAIFGIIVLVLVGALIFGLLEGNGRSERVLRWFARKLHLSEDRAAAGARHVGARLEELASDRQLLARLSALPRPTGYWMLLRYGCFCAPSAERPDSMRYLVVFGSQCSGGDPDHAWWFGHHRCWSATVGPGWLRFLERYCSPRRRCMAAVPVLSSDSARRFALWFVAGWDPLASNAGNGSAVCATSQREAESTTNVRWISPCVLARQRQRATKPIQSALPNCG